MFESIANFFKKLMKSEAKETTHSKDTAKVFKTGINWSRARIVEFEQ